MKKKYGCYMTDAQIERGIVTLLFKQEEEREEEVIIVVDEERDTKEELSEDDVVVLDLESKDEVEDIIEPIKRRRYY